MAISRIKQMRNVLKATGHGLKHFFGARDSRDSLKQLGGQFGRASTKVEKAEILAMMGMYTVYKGSPIGFAKNIYDSIKVGQWKYGDLRSHQQNVDEFLDNIQMSDEGKRTVAKIVCSGSSSSAVAGLSPTDAAAFRQFEADLHIAAGNCVNF
ncbi:MAG: hypothetical protein J0H27_15085 [Xanthomonadales bacterium]|nr:hypothetical protein [Xanthomonadales bacterium]ODU91480.1 MAG: hypothetical protein ABT18_15675 [Rhodanobacter sp. SCN 66-43]OJY86071.1 MAG: hypothetical protein BGP23_05335 [Xanthomonadales bacterium 66-474]